MSNIQSQPHSATTGADVVRAESGHCAVFDSRQPWAKSKQGEGVYKKEKCFVVLLVHWSFTTQLCKVLVTAS